MCMIILCVKISSLKNQYINLLKGSCTGLLYSGKYLVLYRKIITIQVIVAVELKNQNTLICNHAKERVVSVAASSTKNGSPYSHTYRKAIVTFKKLMNKGIVKRKKRCCLFLFFLSTKTYVTICSYFSKD